MKLPTRLAIALGTLVTGLVALSEELVVSHPVHVLIFLVGGFLLFIIHPNESGVVKEGADGPPFAIGPTPPAPVAPPAAQPEPTAALSLP